ncbi:MAG: hypothetical protein ACYDBX_02370 [Patescibacteria group bacterium]
MNNETIQNSTIARLQAEALSNSNEPKEVKQTITEVIAQVISFEALQSQFQAKQNIDLKEKISEALNNNNFVLAQELLNNNKQTINKAIFDLPKYFLFEKDGESYLVAIPETIRKESTTREVTFKCSFVAGDKIQLVSGETKSDVFTFQSEHAVIDANGNIFKPSQLVGSFMEHKLNKKVMKLKSGKGYNIQGISSNLWVKVSE